MANVIDLVLYKDIQLNLEIQSEAMRRDWLLEVSKIRKWMSFLEKELKELMQSGFSSDTAAVSKMLCKNST